MHSQHVRCILALGLALGLASNSPAGFLFTTIADIHTAIPNGTGNFTNFVGGPAVDAAGDVAFFAQGANNQAGIYTSINNTLTAAVDGTTTVPNFSTKFGSLLTENSNFTLDNGQVAFIGGSGNNTAISSFDSTRRFTTLQDSQGLQGVYVSQGGTLQSVANFNTVVPGRTTNLFNLFSNVAEQGNTVAFVGHFADAAATGFSLAGPSGIYTQTAGGPLTKVLDFETNLPGIGTLNGFQNLTLRDGNLAFTAQDASGNRGVYTLIGGTVTKVFESSSFSPTSLSFDGQHVSFTTNTASILSNASGSFGTVADSTTIVPNTLSTPFIGFGGPAIDAGDTLFTGNATATLAGHAFGLYLSQNGSLEAVIQSGTPFDFGVARAQTIGADSFRNGFLAFQSSIQVGGTSTNSGIFLAELSPNVSAAPAPPSLLLAGIGILCLGGRAWQRRTFFAMG